MRYADHAYEHGKLGENGKRGPILDEKARRAGFDNTADYIDDVQGRKDTRVFDGANDRTCWANKEEGLVGWNNKKSPSDSTVHPSEDPDRQLETHKSKEAPRLGMEPKDIQEREGLSRDERQVPQAERPQERGPEPDASAPEERKGPDSTHDEEREDDFPKMPEPPQDLSAEEAVEQHADQEDDLAR